MRLDCQRGRSTGEGSKMGVRLPGVGEEGWSVGGSGCIVTRVGEDGGSSECRTGVGKSMSIAGKICCNEGEDCIRDYWQNGKTLS